MKKLFTSAVLALFLSISVGAQEKIYFDENWEKTTQDKMEFYRETETKGKLTLIKDFYKNGKLQMEGLASDATPGSEIYDGKVTWYSPDGKILNTGTYSGGKQIGPSQTFDEKGRPLEDLVYKADGTFKGKMYTYKDPENSSFYNSITTYESSDSFKTIAYDEDIKGIRYEITTDSKGKYETKYYGDKGKHIGTSNPNNSDENLLVEYYYNPMRVSKIEKYKTNGSVKESMIYSTGGKILQEDKKNKKDGYKTTYDETGKKIGNLTYTYDKESDYYTPQDGEDYQFNYDLSGFTAIDVYKNGSVILNKYFDDNGKLSSEKVLKDDVVQEIRYYYPDGRQKGTLTYKDDMPYNGTLYEELSEQQYKDGVLVFSKFFREGEKLKSEKKLNAKQTGYDSTVYDEKGAVTYTYSQPLEEAEGFTAQVVQYAKGKPGNKAVVKGGVLQSGKIKYKAESGIKEMERSGKWILLKVYSSAEGKLIQDSKVLADVGDQDVYSVLSTTIQEEDLLYEF
ncbi:antitoxin component YwqK of YwqJK toxin-antitoxin module [Chryseobacterium sp. 52]|uniref:membrane-binding protein n=1 Tax=Chryseobacterium sp. 52 TaxID=2035213 RepID=UPI000C182C7F|nr:membrane-binding protein [Chryseobacterium sp. 52]PIF45022.1 antitoxin component YwqK of YwqJK toxin-antitoxin module [Chryseobacterium sp. 52]